MNFRKYIYLIPAVLTLGLAACSVDEHKVTLEPEGPKTPELSADVVEGQLLVQSWALVSSLEKSV